MKNNPKLDFVYVNLRKEGKKGKKEKNPQLLCLS